MTRHLNLLLDDSIRVRWSLLLIHFAWPGDDASSELWGYSLGRTTESLATLLAIVEVSELMYLAISVS